MRGEREGQSREHVTMEAEVGVMCGRGHGSRNAGSLSELEKLSKQILPPNS